MSSSLSPAQSAALLDILTHHDTYQEIRDFRLPGALAHYGPPFTSEDSKPSTSPGLQGLVSRFLLPVPGLKAVPEEFWKVQVHDLIELLEKANLSESYDKGSVGTRKTVSTAISALIEYPIRGTFGGFAEVKAQKDTYDLEKAEDISQAFRDFVDQCVYGNVLENLVKKAAETDKLEEHSMLIKGVHEYVLVNLASFIHYILILSPKGQYLLKLIGWANSLVPYLAIRQVLKIGNVATMISGLVRIILAKLSLTSVTNWMGLTKNEDDGMNLLQQIISQVLQWDIRDLESHLSKIEKDKSCPSKATLKALKDYTTSSNSEQQSLQSQSQSTSTSIVLVILAAASLPSDFTAQSHSLAQDYLATTLSIRDRREIINIACYTRPDHTTTIIKTAVDAYHPIIRHMHDAIDLSDTVNDLQVFVTDLLKVAKVTNNPDKSGHVHVPSVGDFILLLRKHQYSSHKFIHQICKNGEEVTKWYLDWAKHAASQFRRKSKPQSTNGDGTSVKDAGDLTEPLTKLFDALPKETQQKILPILDQETKYLEEMHASSLQRLAEVLKSAPTSANTAEPASMAARILKPVLSRASSRDNSPNRNASGSASRPGSADGQEPVNVKSDAGPGTFLAKWQDLLDSTPITPLSAHGEVKKASDQDVVDRSGEDVSGEAIVRVDVQNVEERVGRKGMKTEKPDVSIVVEALGERFRRVLGEKGCDW